MSEMLREKRATRGTRMSQLVGEAADQDEVFWNADVWNEEESGDESFNEEEEEAKPDVFDSDFNDTESEGSSDTENSAIDKRKETNKKATNKFREPTSKDFRGRVKTASGSGTGPALSRSPVASVIRKQSSSVDELDDSIDGKGKGSSSSAKSAHLSQRKKLRSELASSKRTVRSSTKQRTIVSDQVAKRDQQRKSTHKKRSKKRSSIGFAGSRSAAHLAQKDMLLEGLDTEVENKKWLTNQKIVESDRAFSDKMSSQEQTEKSYIRFISRRGANSFVTFTTVESMPELFSQEAPRRPNKVCVITGLPAKYRDPKTLLPYANIEALRELKRKYH